MGILANGALFETTGEEKIQAWGTGVVRDMVKGVKGDYFVDGDVLQTNGTLTIKGAMVTAGTGRVVIIKPGIFEVGGVLLAAH